MAMGEVAHPHGDKIVLGGGVDGERDEGVGRAVAHRPPGGGRHVPPAHRGPGEFFHAAEAATEIRVVGASFFFSSMFFSGGWRWIKRLRSWSLRIG